MHSRLLLSSAFILLMSASTAHADTVTTFNLSGVTLTDHGSLTGTFDIDVTTGVLTSADLSYTGSLGSFTFNTGLATELAPGGQDDVLFAGDNARDFLGLVIPVTSFVGYSGGDVCHVFVTQFGETNCEGNLVSVVEAADGDSQLLVSGEMVAGASVTTGVTPEPSSFVLIGTGLIGATMGLRRRFAA